MFIGSQKNTLAVFSLEFIFSPLSTAEKTLRKIWCHSHTCDATFWLQCCWNSSGLPQWPRMNGRTQITMSTWGIFSLWFGREAKTNMVVMAADKCDGYFVDTMRGEYLFILCVGFMGSMAHHPGCRFVQGMATSILGRKKFAFFETQIIILKKTNKLLSSLSATWTQYCAWKRKDQKTFTRACDCKLYRITLISKHIFN